MSKESNFCIWGPRFDRGSVSRTIMVTIETSTNSFWCFCLLLILFEAVRCETQRIPMNINNSTERDKNATHYNEVIAYTCQEGYSFNVSDATDTQRKSKCQANGSFEEVPDCIREYADTGMQYNSSSLNLLRFYRLLQRVQRVLL